MRIFPITPQLNPQVVTIGSSSTASTAFGAGSNIARLVATVNCYVAFGATPTATTSGIYLVAGVPEYFGIKPGQKVAVLEAASGGSLSVVEGFSAN